MHLAIFAPYDWNRIEYESTQELSKDIENLSSPEKSKKQAAQLKQSVLASYNRKMLANEWLVLNENFNKMSRKHAV